MGKTNKRSCPCPVVSHGRGDHRDRRGAGIRRADPTRTCKNFDTGDHLRRLSICARIWFSDVDLQSRGVVEMHTYILVNGSGGPIACGLANTGRVAFYSRAFNHTATTTGTWVLGWWVMIDRPAGRRNQPAGRGHDQSAGPRVANAR